MAHVGAASLVLVFIFAFRQKLILYSLLLVFVVFSSRLVCATPSRASSYVPILEPGTVLGDQ